MSAPARLAAPRLRASLAASLLGAALLAGCTGGRGHPVRRSLPMLSAAEVRSLGMYALEEPADPVGADAEAFLFAHLAGVLRTLHGLRAQPVADPRRPVLAVLPAVERSVARRYAAGGFGGPVKLVGALGVAGRIPIPPKAMADMMMDAAVEQQVLAADSFRNVGAEYVTPVARRQRYQVEFRRIGTALWVYDLRFTFVCERRDLPDGRVLLRYDPRSQPRPKHVTLWRGGCILEPDGAGSRVSEILILGTDISLPPFLVGAMRKMVHKKLADRARALWQRAWAGR